MNQDAADQTQAVPRYPSDPVLLMDRMQLLTQVLAISLFGVAANSLCSAVTEHPSLWRIILAGVIPLLWACYAAACLTYMGSKIEDEKRKVQRETDLAFFIKAVKELGRELRAGAKGNDPIRGTNETVGLLLLDHKDQSAANMIFAARNALKIIQFRQWVLPLTATTVAFTLLGLAESIQ